MIRNMELVSALVAIFNILICVLFTLPMIRKLRIGLRRQVEWTAIARAYEKELRERGVTLPPRCHWCSQILPAHVGECPMSNFYEMVEQLKVPPVIKYYIDGSHPPEEA